MQDELNQNTLSKKETKVVRFDWAVKYFLRNKANFDVLEGFLSELLRTDIKIDQLLESESTPTHEKAKLTRVDLLADTDKGKVIIEVQVEREREPNTLWDIKGHLYMGFFNGYKRLITPKINLKTRVPNTPLQIQLNRV